jgi:hypothetical protein
MKRLLLVAAVLTWVASVALAGSVCPAGTGTNPPGKGGPFPHNPDNAATGCNVVITINANGSVTTTVTDATPYENSEDVLIGVVNNSSTPVGSLTLMGSGSIPIFGLDSDGICTYTFVGSGYCNASQKAGTDPQDYYGPTSTFTNISSDMQTGTVNFNPPVPAGGSTYFSLEGVPSASLGVIVGPPTVPAPRSGTLLCIGLAVVLLYQARRKFLRA